MSSDQPVYQRVETRRMVVVDGVAKFVDDHVVAQMLREGHQEETQRDVVAPRSNSPISCARRESRVFRISAPSLPTAARCGPEGRLWRPGAAPRCGLSAPQAATAEAWPPACGPTVRGPLLSIRPSVRGTPGRVSATPHREMTAARHPWHAPKSKHGRARNVRESVTSPSRGCA